MFSAKSNQTLSAASFAMKGSALAKPVITAKAKAELKVNGWYCLDLYSLNKKLHHHFFK
jgi:hypothetical protein